MGFDTVWLAEHHFSSYGICPSLAVLAAAVARETLRVRIGTAVVIAPFAHPVRIAEECGAAPTGGGSAASPKAASKRRAAWGTQSLDFIVTVIITFTRPTMNPADDLLAPLVARASGVEASVVVAVVIFSIRPDPPAGRHRLQVLLVRRGVTPFAGAWSLPGGKLWDHEALDEAAWRQLVEKTTLRASHLEQLYTFELCDVSRRMEAAVVAYYALVRTDGAEIAPGRKTMEAAWFPVDHVPADLAFDNDEILHYALQRLRNKVEYAHVAFQFLPPTFTMAHLRAVYEVILGRRIDPTNFRRRVEATGTIVPTGELVGGGRHRPPALYRCAADPTVLVKTLRPRRPLRSSSETVHETPVTA